MVRFLDVESVDRIIYAIFHGLHDQLRTRTLQLFTCTRFTRLLRLVRSNCRLDAASVYLTYRKPFDLILGAAKRGEWYARGDSNTRPLAS